MPYLIKRNDQYYFNRRVPSEYAEYDKRETVRLSLNTDSRKEATRLARLKNQQLENHWANLASGGQKVVHKTYEGVVETSKQLGINYIPSTALAALPISQLLERLNEAGKRIDKEKEVNALLGGTPVPRITLNEVLPKFFHFKKNHTWKMSPNQIRKWQNPRKLAIRTFVEVVGNIEVQSLTKDHVLKYRDWWLERIEHENLSPETANKNIIRIKSILDTVNDNLKLDLDIAKLFSKILLEINDEVKRPPFETDYIISTLLNPERLSGLNPQAKYCLYAFADTGAGISELVGLEPSDIVLDHEIPHIIIQPGQKRALKTKYRKRIIPLVGFALKAFKACPNGFTDYKGRPDSLSGTLNKYLSENGLFPTDQHTVYSLRHSFQDRLLAVNAPDRVQADLMGHKFHRQLYGNGASLEQKFEWLLKIALKPHVLIFSQFIPHAAYKVR